MFWFRLKTHLSKILRTFCAVKFIFDDTTTLFWACAV